MMNTLDRVGEKQTRGLVRYITAPAGSGKTASVLPIFLRCPQTHYIYITFTNSNYQHFQLMSAHLISNDPAIAAEQGAIFLSQCIKCRFESSSSGPHKIQLDPCPPGEKESLESLQTYLMDMLGEDSKCLFHIDEHRQMCPRVDALGTGKDFSRGAMQLLAGISGAIVVATYTDVPALNALGSSTVCRYPISMPIFNVEDAMGVVPELTLPHTDKIEETIYLRKLATLKLLLYLKLKGLGLISVLHRPHKSSTTTEFLKSFQSAAAIADEYESIDVCIECCAFDPEREASLNRNAAALLVGIPDENYDQFSKLNEIITVAGGLISASLRSLLESTDPDVMAFTYGRDLFLKMLKNSNLLDSTPL